MKYLNSFFAGIIFTLAPVFSLFVGLKNNYFDHYGIGEFFNIIFADSVPFLWLMPVSFAIGYAFFYAPFRRAFRVFYAAILLASLASWVPNFGLNLGQKIFMSQPYEMVVSYNEKGEQNIANVRTLYKGRESIYLLFEGAQKAVKQKRIDKKDAL